MEAKTGYVNRKGDPETESIKLHLDRHFSVLNDLAIKIEECHAISSMPKIGGYLTGQARAR